MHPKLAHVILNFKSQLQALCLLIWGQNVVWGRDRVRFHSHLGERDGPNKKKSHIGEALCSCYASDWLSRLKLTAEAAAIKMALRMH